MAECAEELETQHYLGSAHGHGPVRNAELILFAVFEKTNRDGSNLTPDSFDNKQLKKDGLSVCRLSYTTRTVFDEHVVRLGNNPKGGLTGVATAAVQKIRDIQSKIIFSAIKSENARAFCVLDHVMKGDYDSHATINYGERTSQSLSETQISKIRSKARLDLADVFDPIIDVASISFV